jgi:ATP-dependent DNA ligase
MELTTRAVNGTLAHNGDPGAGIPTTGEWVIEPKLDGWRLIAHVREDDVCFYARSGKTYNGRLPHVEAELLANFPTDTWLDGEAVALKPTDDGKVLNVWGDAQSVMTTTTGAHPFAKAITYMVFDVIAIGGTDARTLPFKNRRYLLDKAFDGKGMKACQLVLSKPATEALHAAYVAMGFEGSMLKRTDAVYASGKRGHGLLKRKHEATEDVVVMGFEAGKDVGAVVFGQYKDGELVERGTCKRKANLIPTPDPTIWSGQVIEVKHNGVFPSGALRHPSMNRVRDDKGAEQCLWS